MRLLRACLATVLLSSVSSCAPGSSEIVVKPDQEKSSTSSTPVASNRSSSAESDLQMSTASTNAGMTLLHWLAGRPIGDQIANSRYDVVVAVVEDVADDSSTNANPPVVALDIEEVLRGDPAVDRRRAIWAPFPHDVDYGDLKSNPIYREWENKPLAGPEIGKRMILLGEMYRENENDVFGVSPVGRFEYSRDNRQLALDGVRLGERLRRDQEHKEKLEKDAYLRRLEAWRAEFTSADIAEFAAAADFIGIGAVSSGPGIHENSELHDFVFQVSRILKGQRQMEYANGAYFVRIWVPNRISELLYARDRDYILFLSEKAMDRRGAVLTYQTIELADGLVEADDEAVHVVTTVLDRHSPKR